MNKCVENAYMTLQMHWCGDMNVLEILYIDNPIMLTENVNNLQQMLNLQSMFSAIVHYHQPRNMQLYQHIPDWCYMYVLIGSPDHILLFEPIHSTRMYVCTLDLKKKVEEKIFNQVYMNISYPTHFLKFKKKMGS